MIRMIDQNLGNVSYFFESIWVRVTFRRFDDKSCFKRSWFAFSDDKMQINFETHDQ